MLRYLNSGTRAYGDSPVFRYTRGAVEFQAVLSGTARPYWKESARFFPPSPRIWVMGPESEHGWTDEPGGTSEIIVFHFFEVNPILTRAMGDGVFLTKPLSEAEVTLLRELYQQLLPHARAPKGLSQVWMDKVKAELSLLALSHYSPESLRDVDQNAQTRVNQAVSWYRERMARAPTVAEVAKGLGVSTVHLRRMFQQVHGRSPHDVFHEIRMSTALRWLKERTLNVSEISDRLGFSEPSAFTRAFRNWQGKAPSRVRAAASG